MGNLIFSTTNEKYIFLKFNYFRADLFSRTLPLREKNVLIFAHFGFVREIARKFSRAKINTNKVSLK